LAIHHREEIGGDDDEEPGIEIDVPGEDRFEIVRRHGDDQSLGASEVEHENRETPGQQGDRENAGEAGIGLVSEPVEDRGHRGDVERPRGGDDQENGEDVRRAPHDLIAHAGDDMTVGLHIEGGAQAERHDDDIQRDEAPENGAVRVKPAEFQRRHRLPLEVAIPNAGVEPEVGTDLRRRQRRDRLGDVAVGIVQIA
jgi:hypothetical protein